MLLKISGGIAILTCCTGTGLIGILNETCGLDTSSIGLIAYLIKFKFVNVINVTC